jgi:hypothetical protein
MKIGAGIHSQTPLDLSIFKGMDFFRLLRAEVVIIVVNVTFSNKTSIVTVISRRLASM